MRSNQCLGIRIRGRILINLRNQEAISNNRAINQGMNHNKAAIKVAISNSRAINQVAISKAVTSNSQATNQAAISNSKTTSSRMVLLLRLQPIPMVLLRWAWMPMLRQD